MQQNRKNAKGGEYFCKALYAIYQQQTVTENQGTSLK